jgi:two-component system nitrogen regulation response regulator GlnG
VLFRSDDVGELARFFLERAAAEGLPRKSLDPAAIQRLTQHGWPGNVRELENLMRRLAALAREDVITASLVEQQFDNGAVGDMSPALIPQGEGLADAVELHLARYFATFGRDLPPDGLYDRVLMEIERPLLRLSLAASKGNQLRAARLLGINRNTLRKKLTDLDIDPSVGRRGD